MFTVLIYLIVGTLVGGVVVVGVLAVGDERRLRREAESADASEGGGQGGSRPPGDDRSPGGELGPVRPAGESDDSAAGPRAGTERPMEHAVSSVGGDSRSAPARRQVPDEASALVPGELGGASVLYAMLAGFVGVGVVVLLATVGPPESPHSQHAPSVAYGPADFDEELSIAGQLPVDGSGAVGEFAVPPPPFEDPSMFPCSDCHEGDAGNPRRRRLREHEGIELAHDEEHRWCLDCHLDVDRDSLRLASGTPVPFGESYRLCGQCHGTQFRDWRNGAHGKRLGYIDGPRSYLLCVNCHDPHAPAFDPIVPLPAPLQPHMYAISQMSERSDAGGRDELH